jgi:hypothetical protein
MQKTANYARYGPYAGAMVRNRIWGDSELKQIMSAASLRRFRSHCFGGKLKIFHHNMEISQGVYISRPAFSGCQMVPFNQVYHHRLSVDRTHSFCRRATSILFSRRPNIIPFSRFYSPARSLALNKRQALYTYRILSDAYLEEIRVSIGLKSPLVNAMAMKLYRKHIKITKFDSIAQ